MKYRVIAAARGLAGRSVMFCLLPASAFANSSDTPLVIIKDAAGNLTPESAVAISKLEEVILGEGSATVWVTLDPAVVSASRGLPKTSSEEGAVRLKRTTQEFARLLHSLAENKNAEIANGRSQAYFDTSGLVRIYEVSALHVILASDSVVLLTSANLY